MKKRLSDLTAHDFVTIVGAINMTYREIAQALGKHQSTISHYVNSGAIPQEVHDQLLSMVKERTREYQTHVDGLTQLGNSMALNVGLLLRQPRDKRRPHATQGRLFNRTKDTPERRKLFPPYRLTSRQYKCVVTALRVWRDEIVGRHRDTGREDVMRDCKLELADIKIMAERFPKHRPYDLTITRGEADVLSRALRHLALTFPYARSVYSTWRKNRGSGSRLNFKKVREQARASESYDSELRWDK